MLAPSCSEDVTQQNTDFVIAEGEIWSLERDGWEALKLDETAKQAARYKLGASAEELLYDYKDSIFMQSDIVHPLDQIILSHKNLLRRNRSSELRPRHYVDFDHAKVAKLSINTIFIALPDRASASERENTGLNATNLDANQIDDMYNEFAAAVGDWNSQIPTNSRVFFGILYNQQQASSINVSPVQFKTIAAQVFAQAVQPTTDGNLSNFGIRFKLERYTSADHNDRMDRTKTGNYYEIMQHEMGHVAGFYHTFDDANNFLHLSQPGAPSVMQSPASQIVPANAADGVALRLLYPTHTNAYNPSLVSVNYTSVTTANVNITWSNNDSAKPLHTKVMYTIDKTSGKGGAFASQSGYQDNTGTRTFAGVQQGNSYRICIAGANYRQDQTFPGRCISVKTFEEPDEIDKLSSGGKGS